MPFWYTMYMSIEKNSFEKYRVDEKKLESYGFVKDEKKYFYCTKIHDSDFEVTITYDDTLEDEEIQKRIQESYELSKPTRRKK